MITRTNETSNEVVTGGVNINQVYYLGVQVSTERYDICQATVGGCVSVKKTKFLANTCR